MSKLKSDHNNSSEIENIFFFIGFDENGFNDHKTEIHYVWSWMKWFFFLFFYGEKLIIKNFTFFCIYLKYILCINLSIFMSFLRCFICITNILSFLSWALKIRAVTLHINSICKLCPQQFVFKQQIFMPSESHKKLSKLKQKNNLFIHTVNWIFDVNSHARVLLM